jgi:hypothetical protein
MLNSKVNRSEAVFARTTVCRRSSPQQRFLTTLPYPTLPYPNARLKYPRAREIRVSGRGNNAAKSTRLQHQSSGGT